MASINPRCGACRDTKLPFEFTMAFQPVVDVVERRIISYEALVRGPGGEGAGEILAKVTTETRYAFDQACRVKAIEMASAAGIDCELYINFLPNAVYDAATCIRRTLDTAARTGFPLSRLTFELVEHEDVAEIAHMKAIIAEYRRHGFKVALDDFGAGFSGLARLAELTPDVLKLDRFFVMGCDADRTRLAIVKSTVSLCRDLRIMLVIEGAETEGEVAALRSVGARYMQGYYFARPAFQTFVRPDDINWAAPGKRPSHRLPGKFTAIEARKLAMADGPGSAR
jgi:EAL domain-containing protein (putative c-di-GMP-specific phosphodiesterase class I)